MSIDSNRRRWLVIHNCVNIGLANCLRLQAPSSEFDSVDIGRFKRDSAEWIPRLPEFGCVVTTPEFAREHLAGFVEPERIRKLPIIRFDAYHPDQCYLTNRAGFLKGPTGDYHSLIVTAAHAKGIPAKHVSRLFASGHMSAFGYLDRWSAARHQLLGEFGSVGLPIDKKFAVWGRRTPFMHTINHPAIHVLYDIASILLEAEGIEPVHSGWIPHDNLLNSAAFPVYPAIAECLSVRGNYWFKKPAQYRCMGLDEFIVESYAVLDDSRQDGFVVYSHQRQAYEKVLANL